MKTLSKSVLIVLCITLLSSTQLFGQEWSEEQKEVWKNVQTRWEDLEAEQYLDVALDLIHDDCSVWYNQDALPVDKSMAKKRVVHFIETIKIVIQDIQPVAIKIYDNVAIVHFYYSRIIQTAQGQEITQSGRVTDILIKEGDKWIVIGATVG
jgi:hypothetical protein